MSDVLPEVGLQDLARGERVLQDVMEQAGDDAGQVELQVGQDVGHREGMRQVGLAGGARLALVLHGREDVGLPKQIEIGVREVGLDLLLDVFEPDHRGPTDMTRGATLGGAGLGDLVRQGFSGGARG